MIIRSIPFDQSWGMAIDVRVSLGQRRGDVLTTCGQCDLTPEGLSRHPGNLREQTRRTLDHLMAVIAKAGMAPADLLQLHAFYISRSLWEDEAAYGAALKAMLPPDCRPVIVLTPAPALFYDGLVVEIDGFAVQGDGRAGADNAKCHGDWAVVAGSLPFEAGAAGLLEDLAQKLAEAGTAAERLCRLVLYPPASAVGTRPFAAFLDSLKTELDPRPILAIAPLPALDEGESRAELRYEALAATQGDIRRDGPNGGWSRGVAIGPWVFASAAPHDQVPDRDLTQQTHLSMARLSAALESLGAGLEDLVKVNVYYAGGAEAQSLHENLSIRSGYYPNPGPASTGIPLPRLQPPGAWITVDALAWRAPVITPTPARGTAASAENHPR